MTFNSIEFLIFYPIVLLGYFASKRMPARIGENFRWLFLLITSYFFYMYYQPTLIILILFTTVVSWISSLVIQKLNGRIETEQLTGAALASVKRKKKLCITITLLTSLGVLFFFKYFNFLSESVLGIAGAITGNEYDFALNLMLPVGISFYTFQTLSYAIDVYRGDIKTERHFGYYALFVSFFPQLVAGPIERPDNLLPQLRVPPPVHAADVSYGLKKMLLGFFKKIVVADLISVYVNAIYNELDTFGADNPVPALGVVIATVLFAAQIYCDFSGYTDIAIGCSRIMGIRLMKNFEHPYMAQTIKEFWNRWHLSLSTWFRDYLYFPLGGSRCSRIKYYRNVMIVFLVSGLWHGAAWTYVIWGALHGVFQVVGHLTIKTRDRMWNALHINPKTSPLVRVLRMLGTFILVDFAWLLFRANTTGDMVTMLKALVTPASWNIPVSEVLNTMGLTLPAILTVIFSVLTLNLFDRYVRHGDECDGSEVMVRRGVHVTLTWIVALGWMLLLSMGLSSTFIYFQF